MNLTTFAALATNHRCGQCKKTFNKPWLVPTGDPYPNNITTNSELLFHWESTHGFPREILVEEIQKALNNTENDWHYDEFVKHGIKTLGDLKK